MLNIPYYLERGVIPNKFYVKCRVYASYYGVLYFKIDLTNKIAYSKLSTQINKNSRGFLIKLNPCKYPFSEEIEFNM